jgi:hypothetical protein
MEAEPCLFWGAAFLAFRLMYNNLVLGYAAYTISVKLGVLSGASVLKHYPVSGFLS